jgi:hypothetical protein
VNRLKLWAYMLLVVGAVGGLGLVASREITARTLRAMDATLGAAADQVGSVQRAMAAEAAAVAQLAARDPGLVGALHAAPPAAEPARKARGRSKARPAARADDAARQAEVERAAKAAVERAEQALGVTLPDGSWWAAARPEWLARRAAQAKGQQREAAVLLREAATGRLRRGPVRLEAGLFWSVAVPAGEGAALAMFLPLDERWVKRVSGATGADVTLAAELPKPVSTAAPREAALVAGAAARPGQIADLGVLPRVVPVLPRWMKVPPLPLLAVRAPELRALAVAVPGAERTAVVLSLAAAPRLEPAVRLQWATLALLVAVLLAGLLIGLSLRGEARVQLPEDLVSAATRIGDGDFSARAPNLAGRLGTIASALNAAAEAAAAQRTGTGSADVFARPAPEAEPSAFDFPARAIPPAPAPMQAVVTTSKLEGGLVGGQFEAAPAPPARAAPPPAPTPADLLGSAARAAPAPAGGGEEGHWHEVFDEFLRVRAECGEPSDGLSYDKFRVKLVKNKEQLVQKYGCKTVRFQVYVKEGKAALKATPVR